MVNMKCYVSIFMTGYTGVKGVDNTLQVTVGNAPASDLVISPRETFFRALVEGKVQPPFLCHAHRDAPWTSVKEHASFFFITYPGKRSNPHRYLGSNGGNRDPFPHAAKGP